MDPTQPSYQGTKSSKRVIILGGILVVVFLVIIGLLIVLILQKQNQKTTTKPPTPTGSSQDEIVATVGEQKIYMSSLVRIAREQYQPEAITNQVLQQSLDIAIERAILDHEARKNGITVSPEEIDIAYANSKNKAINKSVFRYEVLQQKITSNFVKSVTANTIGYWVPPPAEYPQKPEYDVQRNEGQQAMTEAESRIKQGENLLTIASDIYNKYPSLQKILAVNGYIYNGPNNSTDILVNPKIFVLKYDSNEEASLSPELLAILPAIKQGDVVNLNRADQSGGMVIQCLSATQTGYATYEEFLEVKNKELVKIINPI